MHPIARICPRIAFAFAFAVLSLAATGALAELATVTFDTGFYDPNITFPGGQLHGPYDWIEGDVRVSGVWIANAATPGGFFQLGHTHIATSGPVRIGQSGNTIFTHAWNADFQGIHIRFEDNRPFKLSSLRYRLGERVWEESFPNGLPWSYATTDGQLLITPDLVPTLTPFSAFEAQFAKFPIDDGSVAPNNPNVPAGTSPYRTLTFTQFQNVTGVYIGSTVARVYLDSFVLDPPVPTICSNGLDDDADGAADFPADPGCTSANDASEREAGLVCDDGADNDADALADFPSDAGCTSALDASERDATRICDDDLDNDGDGVADYPFDLGCSSGVDDSERDASRACDDGADNDADGIADFPLDAGCTSAADDSEREPTRICDDGLDNDGDGAIDFPSDPGCAISSDASEQEATLVCDDGVDNDGDGQTDFPADPGCASSTDDSEENPSVACNDGVDDDGDSLADFPDDHGCTSAADESERESGHVCDDGVDNDGDTLVDFPLDTDCADIDGASEAGGAPPQIPAIPGAWTALLGGILLCALVLAQALQLRR